MIHCTVVEVSWKEVLSWLAVHKYESIHITITDVLFGKFNVDEGFMIINHVLLLGKSFIYRSKLNIIKPSLEMYKAKLKRTLNIEHDIARKRGKLGQHHRKRDFLFQY